MTFNVEVSFWLAHFNHCFNDAARRMEPMFKLVFHPVEADAMSNVSGRINQFFTDRFNDVFKILSRCIAAAHKGSFSLMKFRMTEADLAFLKSNQNISC